MALSVSENRRLLTLLREQAFWKVDYTFPDEGPCRRALYAKQLDFFRAGATHRERLFLSANRVGKTEGGLYELVLHLTGRYPSWWEGRRFAHPVRATVAGDTSKTVREIIQAKLLGLWGNFGTGMLPKAALASYSPKPGVPEAVEMVRVHHASGGQSFLTLKSFDQGRQAFQGTEQHVVLLDEEPPLGVYTENLLRTMTTDGLLMLTFTPLLGLSETVLQFLPDGQLPDGPQTDSKYVVNAGWDDVPHLSAAQKTEFLAAIPPYQRDARSRGLPMLGSGVIFPVPEAEYLVEPFELPAHWRRVYGLDVGWNWTAAAFGGYDAETDTWYIYAEYKRSQAEPSVHAAAIRAKGAWIPGVIDPAARGRGQRDGGQLLQDYNDLGLMLTPAQNAVEAGLYQLWERLSTGRLKIVTTCQEWRKECRLYRRDERGHIVKDHDHLMDATRYLILSGGEVALAVPVSTAPEHPSRRFLSAKEGRLAWMG